MKKLLFLLLILFILLPTFAMPNFGNDVHAACNYVITKLLQNEFSPYGNETHSAKINVAGHDYSIHPEALSFSNGEYYIQFRISHIWHKFKDDETTINYRIGYSNGRLSYDPKTTQRSVDKSWVSDLFSTLDCISKISEVISYALPQGSTPQRIASNAPKVYKAANEILCGNWAQAQVGVETILITRLLEKIAQNIIENDPKWNDPKWNDSKWNDSKWNDPKWNDPKW